MGRARKMRRIDEPDDVFLLPSSNDNSTYVQSLMDDDGGFILSKIASTYSENFIANITKFPWFTNLLENISHEYGGEKERYYKDGKVYYQMAVKVIERLQPALASKQALVIKMMTDPITPIIEDDQKSEDSDTLATENFLLPDSQTPVMEKMVCENGTEIWQGMEVKYYINNWVKERRERFELALLQKEKELQKELNNVLNNAFIKFKEENNENVSVLRI